MPKSPALTITAALLLAVSIAPQASLAASTPATEWPVTQGDVTLTNFAFTDGQSLPAVKLHYRTLGTPHRDKSGAIDNAVLILHGTGGTGAQFLRPQFADQLFGPGQPLDISRYYLILPDSIGHGGSSKPSDGLRMKFPAYDYTDMVRAQHDMLVKLGVTQLRLIFGTSMGCMHAFVWGESYPGFAHALMPMACLPVEIAGRNRMWRKLSIDAIKADPAWANGDYTAPPIAGLRTAAALSMIAGSVPLRQQTEFPTRAAADKALAGQLEAAASASDANDTIYRLDASRTYNPAPDLARITVPVMWINSADDFINPPNLAIAEAEVKKMPNAQFRLIPETPQGRGHSTHTWASFWSADLSALLARAD